MRVAAPAADDSSTRIGLPRIFPRSLVPLAGGVFSRLCCRMDNQKKLVSLELHHEAQNYAAETTARSNQNENWDGAPSENLLSAGEWARRVLGFDAPFGHDGLPTVWG
jgi:hypothetical protein